MITAHQQAELLFREQRLIGVQMQHLLLVQMQLCCRQLVLRYCLMRPSLLLYVYKLLIV